MVISAVGGGSNVGSCGSKVVSNSCNSGSHDGRRMMKIMEIVLVMIMLVVVVVVIIAMLVVMVVVVTIFG